jgi:hypothetical protein
VSESRLATGLEITARSAGVFLAAVYATGFLIVALHHAQYGISQFDPLKPKIFSTGVVFFLLTAAPVMLAFRAFNIFGLRPKSPTFLLTCKPENATLLKLVVGFSLLPATLGLSNLFLFFFVPFDDWKPWGVTCLVVVMTGFVVIGIFETKHFDKHPLLFTVSDVTLAVLLVVVMYRFLDHHQMNFILWSYGVAIGALMLSKVLRAEEIKQFEWERQFSAIAIVLLTYSTAIYGKIKPSFGGGAPTSVVLYFSGTTPISNSDSADVLLLEETDHGYYVLKNAQEPTAYFLRRELVSAIHFEKQGKQ